ncbi:MAG: DUF1134 domain-containing protein [Hyphomonadaceae bacterium]|nr:DUF1134 domain-containing protein [Hyphomonadaceae bacterium]
MRTNTLPFCLPALVAVVSAVCGPALAQDVSSSTLPPLNASTDAGAATQAAETRAAVEDASTFDEQEIIDAASAFFGETSAAVGQAVQRVFVDQGEPVGYIEGREFAAAIGGGLRYGRGTLIMKDGQRREVFWQGPSIGFDTGANASRVFTLVYDLGNADGIYRRYPGVEGAAFFVAGLSVTYQRAEGVTLAPIRTGVGMRAGVNAGYTAYSMNRRWFPF